VVIWISNMLLAFMAGFGAAFWLLDTGLLPSLVIGTALSATSVGVAMGAWKSAGALGSPNGDLLVDVAELDDISAIGLMAILFAIAPLLATGGDVAASATRTLGVFVVQLVLFLTFCLAFAQLGERRVTAFARRLPEPPQRMLVVAGVGFLIAALAGVMGFSLAIGALAAGLVFSRDPDAVKTEASFADISSFVTPFFFIGIGLQIDPGSLTGALVPGLVLTLAAVAGKILGAYASARFLIGASGATLLAISMVPRAEIAMVVMDQGRTLLDGNGWLYSAMVMVTAITSLGAPLALGPLLKRWPQR
jgi:Kef-type K+ transport system membrane component KefB